MCDFGVADVALTQAPDGTWGLLVEAQADLVLHGVALEGTAHLAGADQRLSNGFQSWSQSGVVALGAPLSAARLEEALLARGDGEVVRDGSGPSWFHSFVGGSGNGRALLAGVTGPGPLRPWISITRGERPDTIDVRLVQGATGESIALAAGEPVELAPWFIALGDELAPLRFGYAEALHALTPPPPAGGRDTHAEAGWNSWYELWNTVDAEAVRANATLARETLAPHLPGDAAPLRIVIDDGWQQAWGDWYADDGFPDGLDGLAADLRLDGFEVGVWLAPLLAHADSAVFAAHPEWFLADVTWTHLSEGTMRILDVTHPGAADHLGATVRRLVDEGLTLLKVDFLFAGTFESSARRRPMTGMQAYDLALRTMREAVGDDAALLAVGAPGVPSLPYVDAWRVGPDIAVEPIDVSWPFVTNEARTIAARWPLCQRVLCDGDPALLRGLPRAEVELGALVAALGGGAFFLSDDLRALPDERRSWIPEGVVALGLAGRGAQPVDELLAEPPRTLTSALSDHIVGRSRQAVPSRWLAGDGTTWVVDWEERTLRVE